MNDSSDADKLHSMVLLLKMRAKSTDELTYIWTENNRSVWKDDEIEAVRTVLQERHADVPEQRVVEKKSSTLTEKLDGDEWFWDPFSETGWQVRKIGCIVIGVPFLFMLLLLLLGLLFHW